MALLAEALSLGPLERSALLAATAPAGNPATTAPASSPSAHGVPTNLPHSPSSVVGRTHEAATVRHLRSATRLLTLTGAGGCGKTRLALEVARRLTLETPPPVALGADV